MLNFLSGCPFVSFQDKVYLGFLDKLHDFLRPLGWIGAKSSIGFWGQFRVGSGLSPGLVLTGSSEDFGLILGWVPSIRGLDCGLNSERPLLDHRLGFGLDLEGKNRGSQVGFWVESDRTPVGSQVGLVGSKRVKPRGSQVGFWF